MLVQGRARSSRSRLGATFSPSSPRAVLLLSLFFLFLSLFLAFLSLLFPPLSFPPVEGGADPFLPTEVEALDGRLFRPAALPLPPLKDVEPLPILAALSSVVTNLPTISPPFCRALNTRPTPSPILWTDWRRVPVGIISSRVPPIGGAASSGSN